MSLLTLVERIPDSERILSGFRKLLDIDSLDDVDTAETTAEYITGAGAADRETQEPLDQAIRTAILILLIRNTEQMAGKRRKQPPTAQDPPQPPAPHTRRSTRVTAGQGGYTDQLERVAVAIETPCQPPRRKVNLPDDEPVNLMAPTPHRPRRKAPHRSGKGLKKKASAAPPSHPVPMVQAIMPVTTHATPDGRFGFQVPAPVPTFVGSQSIADFEQDRIAKKATRPMTSAECKTSGANAQAPGPDHPHTHGVQPPHSSSSRSNATAQSSRGTPKVSPPSHMKSRQPLSRLSASEETYHAPSNGTPSSPLSEEDNESQQPAVVHNQLWDIQEETEGGKEIEEDEEKEGDDSEEDELEEDNSEKDDEEKDSSEKDDEEEGKRGTSAVPVEEKDGRIPGNLFDDDVFTQAQELALTDPDMYSDHDNAPARPQATQHDESTSQPFMRRSLPSKCQQADDRRSPTQSQQSSNTQLQRQSNARNNDHSSTSGRMNDQHLPAHSRNPAQPRHPTQSHGPRVLSQSRPQVELQQWALLLPPPSRSNSIVGDPVAKAERSHRPGDEMIGVEYDLLKRHHSTNGRRRPPSPTYLDSVHSNGTGKYKKARRDPSNERSVPVDPQSLPETNETTDEPAQDQPEGRKGKWSVNPKGTKPVKPTTLAFFPPLWVRLLDLAKARMRLYILVDDAFPPLAIAIDGPCQECLLEAMAFNQESGNDELEDGYFPKGK
ncbi:hypothetical protein OG21DRAFT_1490133 [Imleria badia]|nr:hypothetical protein OG21DRAFT_1490133 [Imleria badia]